MAGGRLELAAEAFGRAREGCGDPLAAALLSHNTSVLQAKRGNIEQAISEINYSIRSVGALCAEDRKMRCLIVPVLEVGQLGFQEVQYPDLLDTAKEAKHTHESLVKLRTSDPS